MNLLLKFPQLVKEGGKVCTHTIQPHIMSADLLYKYTSEANYETCMRLWILKRKVHRTQLDIEGT